jgi:hypothetical protein
MSDGGAAVIVKGAEGAFAIAKFRVGRVVLWIGAAWLALTAVTAKAGEGMLWFFVALFVALVALVGGFLAERRKRAERAAMKNVLLLIGFTLLSIVSALWLVFRRKSAPELPPPSEAELDALVSE